MPVSVTSARISAAVPDAVALNQTKLNQVTAGAKAANINHLTLTLPWSSIQTAASTWNWTAADRAVNTALNAGLGVTIILDGPIPAWTGTVVDPTRFAAYASAVAARYPRVTEFQVWESPNVNDFWPPAPDAVEYVETLKATHAALRKVNPAAKVIFGSLSAVATFRARAPITRTSRGARRRQVVPSEISPQQFLADAYAAGAKGYFSALGYSPLSRATVQIPVPPAPSGDSITQSDALRQVMLSRGDGATKMIWTVGYDTDTAKFTTVQQSLYLDTLLRFAGTRSDHVSQLTLHTYRDQD